MTRFWILLGSSLVHGDALNLSTSLQEQLYQKVVKSHKERVFAIIYCDRLPKPISCIRALWSSWKRQSNIVHKKVTV